MEEKPVRGQMDVALRSDLLLRATHDHHEAPRISSTLTWTYLNIVPQLSASIASCCESPCSSTMLEAI